MLRTRQSQVRTGLLVVLLTGWGGTAHSAGAPAVSGAAPSPSKVLGQISGRTGNVSFPSAYGQVEPPKQDRSLAPYLMVLGEGNGSAAERVPLKETSADVSIAGVIARVQVHQLFENSGRVPIEAVYVFPASTRAAVHGVRMKIGSRTIEAKIDRRQAARESYEAARREGKRASLLEQERANVFTMSVANIMPGDKIAVDMDYSEMLVPDETVYEFVYPTVVGPRYAGGADPAKDHWMANPHLPAGTAEPYRFDIRVNLETGIAIKELSSPSHQVQVNYASATRAAVRLGTPGGGNRDFVLRYRLAGDKIESGLLLWEGEGGGGRRENFFALMMEPPRRPSAAQIPPREYIFLLDVSGSMHGFPLDTAKALMKNLLSRLRPTDLFNVVLFSGAAHVMSPGGSMQARPDEIARAISDIQRQQGGGGTELMGGLELCYRIPKPGKTGQDKGISRTVVVVTDGYVGVEAQAFRFIRERLSEANLFAFGIGSGVNRGLIEGMARAGQGEPFVVLRPEKAAEEAEKLRAYIEQPVLTGVNVAFSGLDAYEVAPQKLPDLMARRPLVLFGKYRGAAGGKIEITGTSGTGRLRQAVEVRPSDVRQENGALRWLWARRWVELLEDERAMGAGKPAEEGITALGLDYKLLTAFTSFVAVDSQVVNAGGQNQNVRQPLPMPEGVSNLAVAEKSAAVRGPSGAFGYGSGGGGLMGRTRSARRAEASESYAAEAPAAAPAPPAPTSSDDRLLSSIGKGSKKAKHAPAEARAADEEKSSRQSAPAVKVVKSAGVGDTSALITALRAALSAPGCGAGQAVHLRLYVDAAGKVTRVDVVGSDKSVEVCWRKLLANLSSSTKAVAAAGGFVEVKITR
jgi:Ca-activated chloride channel homolog